MSNCRSFRFSSNDLSTQLDYLEWRRALNNKVTKRKFWLDLGAKKITKGICQHLQRVTFLKIYLTFFNSSQNFIDLQYCGKIKLLSRYLHYYCCFLLRGDRIERYNFVGRTFFVSSYAHFLLFKYVHYIKLYTCQLFYDHLIDKKSSNLNLSLVSEQHNYTTRSASLQHLNPESFRI